MKEEAENVGWQDLTLQAGWAGTARVKKNDNYIDLEGSISKINPGYKEAVLQLPLEHFPSTELIYQTLADNTTRFSIIPTGQLLYWYGPLPVPIDKIFKI
ncbi:MULTISPECIES: hypothetical protein [unclassified Coleofasciculus]|uniref:hypothetical protein n=1 Tax=unclassified Coleofasciculus TaxID=2692782 RepID=UPI001880E41D|nr:MULTISPECIES: hypothetical protein [unclassified Coleofasciculus]MBE9125600.1 hypothetical protein [Coleofasciculus sp. LEGE 07081]MBE9147314.1 hypothetical protein [Coleofasciculus sp. LEGE 07092]